MFGKIIKREKVPRVICNNKPLCFRYSIENKEKEITILTSMHYIPIGKEVEYDEKKILTKFK